MVNQQQLVSLVRTCNHTNTSLHCLNLSVISYSQCLYVMKSQAMFTMFLRWWVELFATFLIGVQTY